MHCYFFRLLRPTYGGGESIASFFVEQFLTRVVFQKHAKLKKMTLKNNDLQAVFVKMTFLSSGFAFERKGRSLLFPPETTRNDQTGVIR